MSEQGWIVAKLLKLKSHLIGTHDFDSDSDAVQTIRDAIGHIENIASPTPPAGDAGAVADPVGVAIPEYLLGPCKALSDLGEGRASHPWMGARFVDEFGRRLKDTKEWVDFWLAVKKATDNTRYANLATPTGDSVRVPPGWQLVPADLTDSKFFDVVAAAISCDDWSTGKVWKYIIDNAPAAPQQSAQGGWPTVDDAMVERANAADWGCCEWSHQTDNVKAAERIHMREILTAALPAPPKTAGGGA